jgi:AcrR family transcriptional regulator
MRSTKEEARERVIAAARTEFSAHGLAGGRIDRIAAAAHTSKERVYAYFESKEKLFNTVLEQDIADFLSTIVIDRRDLTLLVSTMFDRSHEKHEHVRMLTWARMAGMAFASVNADALVRATEEIEAGQREGYVDPSWQPGELLSILITLATSWAETPDPQTGVYGGGDQRQRREAVVKSAQRLLAKEVPS